jgi:hypothetical protein
MNRRKTMNTEIKKAVENLRNALIVHGDDECTTMTVFFNCEGYEISYNHRTADDLKNDGISMRNVRGDFIK